MMLNFNTSIFPIGEKKVNYNMKRFGSYFDKKSKEFPLPDYGYAYFDHLKAEYENLLIKICDKDSLELIKHFHEKRKNNNLSLTWSDVYAYELIFSRLLEDRHLSRKAWDLRNRYRDIVGLKDYDAYLASKPPEISGQPEADDLRTDIEFLLNKIYLHYSLGPYNERLQNSISQKVTITVLIGLFLIVLTGLKHWLPIQPFSKIDLQPATILMVLYAGAMGGLMSMLQRYNYSVREGDPIKSLPLQYWSRIFIPAINGALFSALLYMIIIGKLIDGTLFPTIVGPKLEKEGIGITDLLIEFRPAKGVDYAKLIVWGFIAGFAERFVPDTLSMFVSKKEKEKEGKNS